MMALGYTTHSFPIQYNKKNHIVHKFIQFMYERGSSVQKEYSQGKCWEASKIKTTKFLDIQIYDTRILAASRPKSLAAPQGSGIGLRPNRGVH